MTPSAGAPALDSAIVAGGSVPRSAEPFLDVLELFMCRLLVDTFGSVDGIMEGPGAPDEDRGEGFPRGGWSVSYCDDMMGEALAASSGRYELLFGRGTEERFAAYGRTSKTSRWRPSATAPASVSSPDRST